MALAVLLVLSVLFIFAAFSAAFAWLVCLASDTEDVMDAEPMSHC